MIWFKKTKDKPQAVPDLATSILCNEATFYNQFVNDLMAAKEEVIIESPFITTKRLKTLIPAIKKLKDNKVNVNIITRAPQEHDEVMAVQSELGIQWFENMGIQVSLENGGLHRKLAIIDRKILYEGSLNILSHSNIREITHK